MPRDRYTAAQYDEVVRLRRAGLSLAEVATRTGVPKASCAWYLQRVGVRLTKDQVAETRGRISEEVRLEVSRRRAAGEAAKVIAADLKLPVKTVYGLAYEKGVRLSKEQRQVIYTQRETKHDYGPLVEMRQAGMTILQIAEKTGVSAQTLQSELPSRGAGVMPSRTWGGSSKKGWSRRG